MDETIMVPATATGPGLLLRPWGAHDVPALVAAHQDPVMRRWLRNPVTSVAQASDVISKHEAAWQAGTGFTFAVRIIDVAGSMGDPVGSVSVRGLGDAAGRGQVGYWTAARARGQGIAARALTTACDWVFRLPVSRPPAELELIHAVTNQASCRVAAKAGFSLASVLPPLPPEFPGDGHLHLRTSG